MTGKQCVLAAAGLVATLGGCCRPPSTLAKSRFEPLREVVLIPFVEAGVPELPAAVEKVRARFPQVAFEIAAARPLPREWIVTRDEPRSDQHGRPQVDGDVVLSKPLEPHRTVIAVTDRDLFAGEWNFLFANFNPDIGQAIVSVARFRTRDGPPGEPSLHLRLSTETSAQLLFFQLVSSTAKVLGMSYDCPVEACALHFPWGTEDLQKKGVAFCERHQAEYDALVKRETSPRR